MKNEKLSKIAKLQLLEMIKILLPQVNYVRITKNNIVSYKKHWYNIRRSRCYYTDIIIHQIIPILILQTGLKYTLLDNHYILGNNILNLFKPNILINTLYGEFLKIKTDNIQFLDTNKNKKNHTKYLQQVKYDIKCLKNIIIETNKKLQLTDYSTKIINFIEYQKNNIFLNTFNRFRILKVS
jgi:hypothetical protein